MAVFEYEGLDGRGKAVRGIVDAEGAVLADGGNFGKLKSDLQNEARAAMSASNHGLERTGMRI